ncbi:hypothetical protein F5B20DRAFT_96093 [Whalleya microplaca]|nr:hypothetical protein F5B20DRAFT_96093 [Whalleya microplaca]
MLQATTQESAEANYGIHMYHKHQSCPSHNERPSRSPERGNESPDNVTDFDNFSMGSSNGDKDWDNIPAGTSSPSRYEYAQDDWVYMERSSNDLDPRSASILYSARNDLREDPVSVNSEPQQCPNIAEFEDRSHPLKSLPSRSLAKRGCKRPAANCGFEGGLQHSSSLDQQPQDGCDPGRRSLACPFYKMDNHKYADCRTNLLRRIKDVKQHVYRKHRQPEFYCPVCFHVFNEPISRDQHIQDRKCVSRPDPAFDGISEDQKKTLSFNPSRGKTTEEQWCDLWRVIFPNTNPPTSPYVGNYAEEMIPLIRSLWDKKSSKLISETLNTHKRVKLDRDDIYKLMETLTDKIFDEFEAESSGSVPPSDKTYQRQLRAEVETSSAATQPDMSFYDVANCDTYNFLGLNGRDISFGDFKPLAGSEGLFSTLYPETITESDSSYTSGTFSDDTLSFEFNGPVLDETSNVSK